MTALAFAPAQAGGPTTAELYACLHCGTATARSDKFCCSGCAAAYELIGKLGLATYYDFRAAAPSSSRPAAAEAVDPTAYVRVQGDVCTLDLAVEGLHCAACSWLIENAVGRDPAVVEARMNATQRKLHLAWRGKPERARELARLLARLGYGIAPWNSTAALTLADAEERRLLRCLAVGGFAAANVMMLSVAVWAGAWSGPAGMEPATRDLLHWLSAAIALPSLAYAMQPFVRSALAALAQKRGNMDVPIVVGVTLATGVSLAETMQSGAHAYFESALMLVFFLLIGRYLERRARGRARSAAAQIAAMTNGVATIETEGGALHQVTPAQIRIGDVLRLASGERCLADVRLLSSETQIDNGVVTGESLPVHVPAGGRIHAGAINLGPPVRAKVDCVGDDMLLARLSRLLEAAEQRRSRYAALADRVARWYTPVVHGLAAATAIAWYFLGGANGHEAVLIAAAVLIVTCPCALALAQPTVATVAISRLARQGVLVTSPTALERLAEVDTIVLDKTGTLTRGKPVLLADPARDREALAVAASLALTSRHPLARALAAEMPDIVPAADVVEVAGQGLRAGDVRLGSRKFCAIPGSAEVAASELWLQRPGHAPVCFRFHDELRGDAAAAIAALGARGYDLHLLSGDIAPCVAAMAGVLGLKSWEAGLGPEDKLARVGQLRDAGRHVLMVGDGINDAPTLAAAHASMSPGDATDIAASAADALFRGGVLGIVTTLDLAQGAVRAMRANLFIATIYNLVAVPIAIAGLLTPPIAAAAMSSSSLLVILNALRLGSRQPAKQEATAE